MSYFLDDQHLMRTARKLPRVLRSVIFDVHQLYSPGRPGSNRDLGFAPIELPRNQRNEFFVGLAIHRECFHPRQPGAVAHFLEHGDARIGLDLDLDDLHLRGVQAGQQYAYALKAFLRP